MKIVLGVVAVIAVIGVLIAIGQTGTTTEPIALEPMNEGNDILVEEAPQPDPMPEAQVTVVDLAIDTQELSTLVSAVSAAGLVDTLSGDGPFTVFAPTDDAFAALPPEVLQELLEPENVDQLTEVLGAHVVIGIVTANELEDGTALTTITGDTLPVSIDADGIVTIAGSTVLVPDVMADNGVVHVIDTVIVDV